MSYAAYLRTDAWKQRRNAAIEAAGRRCQLCNYDRHLDAHHRTYERIGQERPEDLIVLCRLCHNRHHGAMEGPKEPRVPLDPDDLAKALQAQARARKRVQREKTGGPV